MAYVWLDDLDLALAAAGIPYQEINQHPSDVTGATSWKTRGRPYSTGSFDPDGVLCHHTASAAGTSDAAEINVLMYGNGSAPGPIAQLFIGRQYQGVYLIAAGRANHGGSGRRPGIDTGGCADMNAALLGIEVSNNGVGEPWPDWQTDIYGATVAALCAWYGWGDQIYLHATTGPPSGGCNQKIDPAGPWQGEPHCTSTWNLDVWREFVASCAAGPAPGPTPPARDETRRKAMGDFVVVYGMAEQGCPDGTVLELIGGRKRWVSGEEWYQVLKGAMAGADGAVPDHSPWAPVAFVTNGWYALGLPDYDDATGRAVPTVTPPDQ